MIDLDRFLRNPFARPEISQADLVPFTADHLALLAVQNTEGRFNDAITATDALFTALSGRIVQESTAAAIRRARTAALEAKRATVHRELSQLEGLIHARFPRGSATYVELLPGGLAEFREVGLDLLNARLESLLERLEPHAATIGAADVAALAALQEEWATLRGEQVKKKGVSTDAAGDRRAASDALRGQLFDNLLLIARLEKGRPERIGLYMRQSLLEEPTTEPEPAAPPAP